MLHRPATLRIAALGRCPPLSAHAEEYSERQQGQGHPVEELRLVLAVRARARRVARRAGVERRLL